MGKVWEKVERSGYYIVAFSDDRGGHFEIRSVGVNHVINKNRFAEIRANPTILPAELLPK